MRLIVQIIDVSGKIIKTVTTSLVIRLFINFPGILRTCASLNISYNRFKAGVFTIYFNNICQQCYGYSLYLNGFMKKWLHILDKITCNRNNIEITACYINENTMFPAYPMKYSG